MTEPSREKAHSSFKRPDSQQTFVYRYVVMFSDIDQFQHMSFVNYLKLMFLATDALFMDFIGLNFLSQYRCRMKEGRMEFKRQSVGGDRLMIKVNAVDINKFYFTLSYNFILEGGSETVALGSQKYEILRLVHNDIAFIPEEVRRLLESIKLENQAMHKYDERTQNIRV